MLSKEGLTLVRMVRLAGFYGARVLYERSVEEMAKQPAKKRGEDEDFGTIKPDLGGAEAVAVPEGVANFFDFEERGQKIVGTLVGTTIIKPKKGKDAGKELERWVFLPDGEADTVTLPSYYDLELRITKLISTNQLPIRGVVIQYLGKVKANTPAGFVKRFAVGRLPAGEQQALAGRQEVPF